jgi:hypothetical protein
LKKNKMKGHISMKKNLLTILGMVLVFALGIVQAQAATVDINLSGKVSDGTYYSFHDSVYQYDQWVLPLSGFPATHAIVVSQGDTINATIKLDQSFTIPASVSLTSFIFGLWGPSFPAGDTATAGSTSFFLGVTPIIDGSTTTSSSGWIPNAVDFFPPNNGAITFDSLLSSFTITQLGGPATLSSAQMYYTLYSPAPVPIPAAAWLLGSGLVGLLGFRRKFSK